MYKLQGQVGNLPPIGNRRAGGEGNGTPASSSGFSPLSQPAATGREAYRTNTYSGVIGRVSEPRRYIRVGPPAPGGAVNRCGRIRISS